MTQPAVAYSIDLMQYLVELLRPLLDERGLAIWYDKDGALEHPIRETASRHGWRVAPAAGAKNELAARVEVETQLESDSLVWVSERKWIVYQRGKRRDPSWYEDLELLGRRVQKTLAEVIAEKHGLSTVRVAALINERTARRRIESWDRVFPTGTDHLDRDRLSSALLTLALDQAEPLAPKDAILRFLRDPTRLAEVLQVG